MAAADPVPTRVAASRGSYHAGDRPRDSPIDRV